MVNGTQKTGGEFLFLFLRFYEFRKIKLHE